MQNKGLIKLFALLFGLVSLYQLSFTYISNKVEDEAKAFANAKYPASEPEKRNATEASYLDSIGKTPVFSLGPIEIDYDTAKDKELNKGLDLKGGINVILQVSVKDILKGLANNSKDGAFNQALNDASVIQKDAQETYLESFFKAFEALPGENTLASPDIFFNKNLEDDINASMTNEDVKPVIERKIDESITAAFEVLRKRIDKFGVTQPNIQRIGKSARILVELPGAKDVNRVKKLLQSTAQLEFWDVYKIDELAGFLEAADAKLAELNKNENPETEVEEEVKDSTDTEGSVVDELIGGEDVKDSIADSQKERPLLGKMQYPGSAGRPELGTFLLKDTASVNGYLRNPQVRALLSNDQRFAKFVWGIATENKQLGEEVVTLYAIKSNRDQTPPLAGGVVVDAMQSYDQLGRIVVSMQMNARGARIWEQMTGKAFNNGTQIAIVLDDIVYSAPGVTSGPIAGGNSQISGDFTIAEGQDLANVLRAGKLPASAEIIQGEVIGPTLGQEAIDSGIFSFLLALAFVLVWMVFYYGRAGIFADVALVVNIVFIFGILAGLGAVLTLPGIAGIILTIGMSVDANVLIFERIKEELAKGKAQKDAINDGFSNALSSILDANITTGLTGLILLVFGTGPIQGFATTLLIGIATSLFTAIFITRLFIDSYTRNGKPLPCTTSITKNILTKNSFVFLKKRKIAYVISGIMIAISLGSLLTVGLNQGVDFVGGRTYTVRFDRDVDANQIEEDMVAKFGSAEAKTYGGDNQLKITTKYKVDESGTEIDEEIERMMFDGLKTNLPDGFTYDQFIDDYDDKSIGRMETYKVSPTIADDIKKASFWAVLGSLIVVFLYILLRFRKWQFSLGAVTAVFHDVLLVLGIFSLTYKIMPFNMEIGQSFIAAILTVIGYSLNDTVVVFDRIREYFNDHSTWKMNRVIDAALNSTLSRTLNTSLTTMIVLLSIFVFGAESIRGLIFALMVGVVVGTYSSLFIATPVMFDTVKKKGIDLTDKNKKEEEEV